MSIIKRLSNKFSINTSEKRIDENLPYKLNNFLQIDQIDFALNKGGLKTKYPGKDVRIKAIGFLKIADINVIRYYLENLENNIESFVQSIKLKDGSYENTLFTNFDEVYPDEEIDEEEGISSWDCWLNKEEGMIGSLLFYVNDDDDEDDAYVRIWTNSEEEKVDPISVTELIYTDPFNHIAIKINHQMMLYGKEINDITENLLLSAIETDDKEAFVSIDTGIQVSIKR